ncbi:aminoglycoside 3'-phosphotransferase [Paenibacillus sp. WQ 127069]|uniref:Aminoglycoside 3'-phosphotransferase n=1 Tax=Paenibacillus baimaensis TaxID=2982185 RepID=A0ABT2UBU4_9BACL|nr:APH(3') family aminoglycoside O-phosphotransferase [Paenibacillus sp. WQ 127069]MCU6792104.1 aminoglycoside 3'-phosphotransferase [Paenibacillus sp. WQ 127069]
MQEFILPENLSKISNGYTWRRITIGHSESKTYLLTGTSVNLYLKIQSLTAIESLLNEKNRLEWLQGKLSVPEVLYYGKDYTNEYLLITEIAGVNASDKSFEMTSSAIMKQLAAGLREVHEVKIDNCPFNQRLESKIEEARKRVQNKLVDEEDFDQIRLGLSPEDLLKELLFKRPMMEDLVFTHGDYCLPNIIIDNDRFSGVIDWGRAGIADRYQDLALAARSITYNFGKKHVQHFLDEYGIKELDESKIYFYQLLDEFF